MGIHQGDPQSLLQLECDRVRRGNTLTGERLPYLPPTLEAPRICGLLPFTAEKAMAPHSSTLAWKIPWTEEPGKLQSMGLQRVGHN